MAVTSFPFNSIVVDGVPDRPANAESLAAYLAGFFGNGIAMQADTALQVEPAGEMDVCIRAGMGNINGKVIIANAAEIITLDTASASLNRIDRVVFRLDEVNRRMEFGVLTGTPAADPVAPELTRGADIYEMCLAEIRVPAGASEILANYITDTRADADLCGIMHSHGAGGILDTVVPIEKGGHGKTTAEEGLLALGGMSKMLLWENASPDSTFPEQEISVDLSDYDEIEVEFRHNSTSTQYFKERIKKGKMCRLVSFANTTNEGAYMRFLARDVTVNETSVAFTGATYKQVNNTAAAAASNISNIPIAIYGIKGVQ